MKSLGYGIIKKNKRNQWRIFYICPKDYLSGNQLMQNLKFNHEMEHDKQVQKRMKVTSALAHYSRLFSMKIGSVV